MATIGRGWGDSDVCSINISNQLEFSEDGLIYNTHLYIDSSQSAAVSLNATYQGSRVGIVAYYSDNAHLEYEVSSTSLSLHYIEGDKVTILSSSNFSDIDGHSAPVANDVVTLGLAVSGNTIICTYGAGATVIFTTTQTMLQEGYLGIVASAEELINSFSVSTNQFEDWTPEIDTDAIAVMRNQAMTIENNDTTFSYIYQDLTVTAGDDYTVSFDSSGYVDVKVVEQVVPSNVISSQSFTNTVTARNTLTFNTAAHTSIRIEIGVPTTKTGTFTKPMLEHTPYATTYTLVSRADSILSFPTSSFNTENGGFAMWFKPQYAYTTETIILMYVDDTFKIEYAAGDFSFTYGTQTLTDTIALDTSLNYHIIATWDNGGTIKLNVYNGTADSLQSTAVGTEDFTSVETGVMYILSNGTSATYGTVDNIVLITGTTTVSALQLYRVYVPAGDASVLLQYDSDSEEVQVSRSKVIINPPKPFAPVVIQGSNGTIFERVYFVNENNQYTLENTEFFVYNGDTTYDLLYNDFISAIITIEDDIYQWTNAGITLNSGSIEISRNILSLYETQAVEESPEKVDGRQVYLTHNILAGLPVKTYDNSAYTQIESIDYENNVITLSYKPRGTVTVSYTYADDITIAIEYVPSNVFCVNYINSNYEIEVSNPNGETLTLTYEQDTEGIDNIVRSVEANPYVANNNNGFIYITDTTHGVVHMIARATPDVIAANGTDTATIVIDCYGQYNVPTGYTDITTSPVFYGTLTEYFSSEESEFLEDFETEETASNRKTAIAMYGYPILETHRSGRFVYKYTVNQITGGTYTEYIDFIDSKTNVGIRVPIRITGE